MNDTGQTIITSTTTTIMSSTNNINSPLWVYLCGNIAPFASIIVFLAVSFKKFCLFLLSVASCQFVYSEAFLSRNKKSSFGKTSLINPPYLPRISQPTPQLQTVPESNWGDEKDYGIHVRGGDSSAQQQQKSLVREMM